MKRLIPLSVLISMMVLSSCEEGSDSSPLSGFTAAGITGIRTTNTEEFCCWNAGSGIHFTAGNTNYDHWTIAIGESYGALTAVNGDPLHWRGNVKYMEKNKKCKDIYYVDSLKIDITTSEAGWNEMTYMMGSFTYEKGTVPPPPSWSTYYIKSESGNINTLNVSNANHAYIFRFKTRTAGDINAWKLDQMPDGWMNTNGRMSMLMVPVLYSMFQ